MSKSKGGKITDEVGQKCIEICNELACSNKGLHTISKSKNISHTTFYDWLKVSQENADRYTHAREAQADFIFDEIIEISDDNSNDTTVTENGIVENREFVSRSRLRVDARKWIASKLKPKKYGDKVEISGNQDAPIQVITGQVIK